MSDKEVVEEARRQANEIQRLESKLREMTDGLHRSASSLGSSVIPDRLYVIALMHLERAIDSARMARLIIE